MARIVVSFPSKEDALRSIKKLADAGIGEVRMRDLNNPGRMITPDLGSVDVRPEEMPKQPEAQAGGEGRHASASIPTTGESGPGLQVEIVISDEHEEEARRILAQ